MSRKKPGQDVNGIARTEADHHCEMPGVRARGRYARSVAGDGPHPRSANRGAARSASGFYNDREDVTPLMLLSIHCDNCSPAGGSASTARCGRSATPVAICLAERRISGARSRSLNGRSRGIFGNCPRLVHPRRPYSGMQLSVLHRDRHDPCKPAFDRFRDIGGNRLRPFRTSVLAPHTGRRHALRRDRFRSPEIRLYRATGEWPSARK